MTIKPHNLAFISILVSNVCASSYLLGQWHCSLANSTHDFCVSHCSLTSLFGSRVNIPVYLASTSFICFVFLLSLSLYHWFSNLKGHKNHWRSKLNIQICKSFSDLSHRNTSYCQYFPFSFAVPFKSIVSQCLPSRHGCYVFSGSNFSFLCIGQLTLITAPPFLC